MSAQPEITQRDLQNRSKEIMDAVQGGQSFAVTRDGHQIGELIPPAAGDGSFRARSSRPRPAQRRMSHSKPSGPTRRPRPSRRRTTPVPADYAQGPLDTNIVILRKRIDPEELPAESAISAITLAEFFAGPHEVRRNDAGHGAGSPTSGSPQSPSPGSSPSSPPTPTPTKASTTSSSSSPSPGPPFSTSGRAAPPDHIRTTHGGRALSPTTLATWTLQVARTADRHGCREALSPGRLPANSGGPPPGTPGWVRVPRGAGPHRFAAPRGRTAEALESPTGPRWESRRIVSCMP